MAKDPVTHVLTPQEYLQKVAAGTMPPMNNHQMMKEMAENTTMNNQTKFLMMVFREYRAPDAAYNSTTTKTQVTHVSLQTDSCDTLYVSKNTLTAYTIVIVQNAQALQHDQMHVALQTARNQAFLEMPIQVEELMTAHFNLAVLSNETDYEPQPQMPRNLKPLLLTPNHLPQMWMSRPTLRYPVCIMLQIAIQRSNILLALSPQPVEENTDLLMAYRQVTRRMTLGTMILILMSTHTQHSSIAGITALEQPPA